MLFYFKFNLKPGFHIVVSVVSVVRKKFIGQIEFIGSIYTGDGSSVEKDHPSSINTGRTMRRTIGVSCDSSRVFYWTSFLDGFPRKQV